MRASLQSFSIAELPGLRFDRLGHHNSVRLGDFWQDQGRRRVFSTDALLECAVLLPGLQGWWQMFYNSQAALLELLVQLPREPEPKFTALPEFAWDLVRERWPALHFNDHWLIRALPGFQSERQKGASSLNLADLDFLCEHQPYLDEYGGRGYLAHRLEHGITAAFRRKGKPIAWGIGHEDGTLGFLRVRREYRRQGFGLALVRELARRAQQHGWTPLGHVSHYNRASLAIIEKTRFEIVGKESWVRRRTPEEIRQYERGIF